MATIIACWEVLIVSMAVTAHVAVRLLHHLHPVTRHGAQASTQAVSTSSLHVVGLVLTYVLAVAAAIALWEMRRIAFILLAARFGVELLLFAEEMFRPLTAAGAQHPAMRLAFIGVDVVALAVNAAIAWYAWYITRDLSTPLPATEPQSPDASAEKELTTSQFYLSPDHKKTIHKD
jgi:hypothetical protein